MQDKNQSSTIIDGFLAKWSSAFSLSRTQLVAVLVLIPALPMLLLSIGSLALFYLSPDRFGSMLSRLPGETYLRTILIFAPVTLFAIVVLAFLYAIERPSAEPTKPHPSRPLAASTAPLPALAVNRMGIWILGVAVPLLLISIMVRAAAFLAPTRFDRFLENLPGTDLLIFLVHWAPFGALGMLLLGLFLSFVLTATAPVRERRASHWAREEDWAQKFSRAAVTMVLAASLPVLFLSLLTLALFVLKPEGFQHYLTRLPSETLLRLGLLFAPASLIAVVTLAVLYLISRSPLRGHEEDVVAPQRAERKPPWQIWAPWAMIVVLAIAGVTVVGLAAGIFVLLFR